MYISLSTRVTRQGSVKRYPNLIENTDSGTGTRFITGTAKIGSVKITVASSELNETSPFVNFIKVNGVIIANNVSRGHTLAVINPTTGATVSVTTFDTYGTNNSTALNNALLAVPDGYIIAICSYDATTLDVATRNTLNTSYNAPLSNTWAASRVAHYFVGMKISTSWILTTGYWNDSQTWNDYKTWKDN